MGKAIHPPERVPLWVFGIVATCGWICTPFWPPGFLWGGLFSFLFLVVFLLWAGSPPLTDEGVAGLNDDEGYLDEDYLEEDGVVILVQQTIQKKESWFAKCPRCGTSHSVDPSMEGIVALNCENCGTPLTVRH